MSAESTPTVPSPPPNRFAVLGVWFGFSTSFLGTWIVGPAVLFSFLGVWHAQRYGNGKRMISLGFAITAIGMICHYVAWPQWQRYKASSADHAFQKNRANQVAMALDAYLGYKGSFPSAHFWDGTGQPPEPAVALSWRFRLLPFVEEEHTYRVWKKDEPWDSPTNLPLAEQRNVYSDVYWSGEPFTRYRVFYGNGALFELYRQVKPAEITDGKSNTILFVQAGQTVPWPLCNELPYDPAGPLPPLGRPDRNYFLAAMADGSIRTVRKNANPTVIRSAITRAGGEPAPEW